MDRFQRRIDHAGAVDRRRRERCGKHPAKTDQSPGRIEKHPTDAEHRSRQEGQHGKHAFARQPR